MQIEGWELKKLEELCPVDAPITYGVLKPGEYVKGGIPLLQIKDLADGKIFTGDLHLISDKLDNEYKRSRIVKNDILISLVGTVGRIAKYESSNPANIHRNIGRIRTNNHEYIFYFLHSEIASKIISGVSSGSSQSALNLSTLRAMEIPLPPLDEQKKIAEILSTWDKAIEAVEKLVANSQLQKKALMQQLLTGQKRLLDDNGVKFEDEWEEKSIKSILTISKGQQLNRDTLNTTSVYPVINGGIVPSGYTDDFNTNANTITISEGGNSCGYVSFQKTDFWCGGHCYALKKLKLNLEFTYHLLKFNEIQIMRLRVGSGLPNIQKKDLENLQVSFPTNSHEQEKIAQVLTL